MLHLIFCSLSSLTCRENIFIKVSVVWLVLSGCQVCPVLYISAEGCVCVCVLCSLVWWWASWAQRCAVQTLHLSEKSICILIPNSNLKKKKSLNSQIYGDVNYELWLTLKFPVQFFFVGFKQSISAVHPLQSEQWLKRLFFCPCRRPVNLAR